MKSATSTVFKPLQSSVNMPESARLVINPARQIYNVPMNVVTGNYTVYCLKYRLHFATQEDGIKELQTLIFMITTQKKISEGKTSQQAFKICQEGLLSIIFSMMKNKTEIRIHLQENGRLK